MILLKIMVVYLFVLRQKLMRTEYFMLSNMAYILLA